MVEHVVSGREQPPDLRPPHADALAVDQADLAEAEAARLPQVLFDRGGHVLGAERVQVERVFDRDALQTAGLSVVARVTRLGSTGIGSPQTHAVRKAPSAATSGEGVSILRPSLTERSDDHRLTEPETPPATATYWIVSSPAHFGHTVQK